MKEEPEEHNTTGLFIIGIYLFIIIIVTALS